MTQIEIKTRNTDYTALFLDEILWLYIYDSEGDIIIQRFIKYRIEKIIADPVKVREILSEIADDLITGYEQGYRNGLMIGNHQKELEIKKVLGIK